MSQAITLIESTLPQHRTLATALVQRCLPFAGNSIRIGITGVPGVGKSTFIEALGSQLVAMDKRLAVLAVDPTSSQNGGSILGDKTRMPKLATHPNAYIRPSPTAGSLGGVTQATRETILLCEAAGFEVILVETVGVGQSEVAVHGMVDCFLLLALTGAGDELQGIKRGIMELADLIAITKADGENKKLAQQTRGLYRSALSLFPPTKSGWRPQVTLCSAVTGEGIDTVWQCIADYTQTTKQHGFFEEQRREQARGWLRDTLQNALQTAFFAHPQVAEAYPALEQAVLNGERSPFEAAQALLTRYRGGENAET